MGHAECDPEGRTGSFQLPVRRTQQLVAIALPFGGGRSVTHEVRVVSVVRAVRAVRVVRVVSATCMCMWC